MTEVLQRYVNANLIGDSESDDTDAHPFDSRNLIIQLVRIVCRFTVCDENDQSLDVRSLLIVSAEHFQSRYLETACRVRVLAKISDSVHGPQNLRLRRVVFEIEVDFRFVS